MKSIKQWPVLALIVGGLATPTLAADEKACDAFVAAFGKAGKALGKEMSPEDGDFWKKQCAKKPDPEVKKDTACLQKVRTDADMNKCLK